TSPVVTAFGAGSTGGARVGSVSSCGVATASSLGFAAFRLLLAAVAAGVRFLAVMGSLPLVESVAGCGAAIARRQQTVTSLSVANQGYSDRNCRFCGQKASWPPGLATSLHMSDGAGESRTEGIGSASIRIYSGSAQR